MEAGINFVIEVIVLDADSRHAEQWFLGDVAVHEGDLQEPVERVIFVGGGKG
jgi:hypothetical protein